MGKDVKAGSRVVEVEQDKWSELDFKARFSG
jgi:hypothetical protein